MAPSRAQVEALLLKTRPTPKFASALSFGGGKVRYLGFDAQPVPAQPGQRLAQGNGVAPVGGVVDGLVGGPQFSANDLRGIDDDNVR